MIRNIKVISEEGEILSDTSQRYTDSMNEQGYRIPSHKSGVRTFTEIDFPADMTDSDIGKMLRLSKDMVAGTNLLGYKDDKKVIGYTCREIGEKVGIESDRPSRNYVNKMIKLGVIKKVKGTGYFVNPIYFSSCGTRITLGLFLMFKEDMPKILPKWAITEFIAQENQLNKKEKQNETI